MKNKNYRKNSGNTIPRKYFVSAAAAAALTLLSFSCSPKGALMRVEASEVGFSSETGSEHEEVKTVVRVARIERSDLENRIKLSGEVYATGRVNVMPDVGGLLTKILVSPGDSVSYNQIVAYVDSSRPGVSYAASPVRSKVSGTITAVPAVAGNQVSVQSVIAVVGNLDRLEVETRVPETYLSYLRPGMKGRVTSRSYPDSPQEATVTELSPVVDARSRTVLVTLVPESHSILRPGQAVTVDLVLENHENAVSVPSSSLTERSGGQGVFVVENGKASWRGVGVGTKIDGVVEVTSGLSGGEDVVVAGIEELSDGDLVRIVEG